jgi:hypothetical protein
MVPLRNQQPRQGLGNVISNALDVTSPPRITLLALIVTILLRLVSTTGGG